MATAIACQATTYAVIAVVVAVPCGLIAARLGWRLVADDMGVPVVHAVPLAWLGTVTAGALALANLAAAYPAWSAARLPTSVALRTE